MSKNFVVYHSRNRFTGTLCLTLDTKHADSTIPYVKETRYAAMCVEHKEMVTFSEHYPAGRAIAHVDEWCKQCQAMIKKGERLANIVAMNPADLVAPIHNDLRMNAHNDAHDKQWTLRQGKKVIQRTAEQSSLIAPVKVAKELTPKDVNDATQAKAKRARKAGAVKTIVPAAV